MSPVARRLPPRILAAAAAFTIVAGACAGTSEGEALRPTGAGRASSGEPAADPPADTTPDGTVPEGEAPDADRDDGALAADGGSSDSNGDAEPEERVPDGPNELPRVAMIDIATGDEVTLSDFAPSDTPIVLWFWAPH